MLATECLRKALAKHCEQNYTHPTADLHALLHGEAHKVLHVLSPASFSMKAGPVGAGAGLLSL